MDSVQEPRDIAQHAGSELSQIENALVATFVFCFWRIIGQSIEERRLQSFLGKKFSHVAPPLRRCGRAIQRELSDLEQRIFIRVRREHALALSDERFWRLCMPLRST